MKKGDEPTAKDLREEEAKTRPTGMYVDARNFYHALLEPQALAWFDVERYFTSRYASFKDVRFIKYFTSPGMAHLEKPLKTYHDAIAHVRQKSKLQFIWGRNQGREERGCTSVGCKYAVGYGRTEPLYKEKQTDVALAVHVLTDVIQGGIRTVLICSDDTDFVPLLNELHRLRETTPEFHDLTTIIRSPGDLPMELKESADLAQKLSHSNLEGFRLQEKFTRSVDGETVEFAIPRRFKIKELRREREQLRAPNQPVSLTTPIRLGNCESKLKELLQEELKSLHSELVTVTHNETTANPKRKGSLQRHGLTVLMQIHSVMREIATLP